MIVDPWGHPVATASDGPGLALAEIDLDRVARIRQAIPVARPPAARPPDCDRLRPAMKSCYQLFKLWVLAVLPLTKDAIHVYIGFLCLLVALIVFRRRLSSYQALIPGLLVSLTHGGLRPAGRLLPGRRASTTSSTRT